MNRPRANRQVVVIESENELSGGEDEADLAGVQLRSKQPQGNNNGVFRRTLQRFQDDGGPAVFSYLTLKVLLWDISISLGDTVTDFCQGLALFFTEGKQVYGIITLAINWVPGVPAAVHLVSMYRDRWPWHRTLLYALLLLLFYPIVPVVAYANLLWNKPKNPGAISKEFREAEFLAAIANAISGGIESPVQLLFQTWLIFNGVLQLDWHSVSDALSLTDWQGNTIYLPITAAATLAFSVLSIVKASIELNVVRVHVQDVSSWRQGLRFAESVFDHLPFLTTQAFFRIVAIVVSITYLNSFGLIPIALFWISTILLGQKLYSSKLEQVPLWLISFISLFIPICFTSEPIVTAKQRRDIVSLQYKTFRYFSLSALLMYGVALVAIGCIVNLPLEATNFLYSPETIFSHFQFNNLIAVVGSMGIISAALSIRPTVTALFRCESTEDSATRTTMVDEDDTSEPCLPDIINHVNMTKLQEKEEQASLAQRKRQKTKSGCKSASFILVRLLFTGLAFAPLIASLIMYSRASPDTNRYFIYYSPASNSTVGVQALLLTSSPGSIQGVSKHFFSTTSIKKVQPKQFIPPGVTISPDLKPGGGELSGEIVVISRLDWAEKKEQLLSSDASAIVIIDNESYRPSSPLPKLVEAREPKPVFLARKEEEEVLLVQDGILVWVSVEGVPEPAWTCSESGCLPPIFESGYIAGEQYRTRSCVWGGRPCLGFENSVERENFCNGPKTRVCPVNDQEYGIFQSFSLDGAKRTLRSSPASCLAQSELLDYILDCDRGAADWSRWLGWETLWQDGDVVYRSRRRYCFVRGADCILEEQDSGRCCRSQCNDPTLQTCYQIFG